MASPNIETSSTKSVFSGGVDGGATIGASALTPAGMHGAVVVQDTGYGAATNAAKTTSFVGTATTLAVLGGQFAALQNALIAKGIIGL